MGLVEYFELHKQGSSVKTEVLAGATTFLAMAYIILVNPTILHAPNVVWGQGGMPLGPVVIATIVSAGVATILTGIYAKRPFAMAPYMGENALFAFSIIPLLMSVGYSGDDLWRLALGAVFWGGVIFLLVSVTGVRTIIARAIPPPLALSWGVGIGLFLMFIGFANAGIAVAGTGVPVKVGNLASPRVLVAITGTAVTLALYIKRVPGSILLGMLATMAIAAVVGVPALHPEAQLGFPNWGEVFGRLDVLGALRVSQLIPIIVLLFLVDIFDTLGTVAGLAAKARYTDEKGRVVGVDRVFHVDAAATIFGAVFGTSTTGTYIESATGMEVGGRTGLTAVVTGLLFMLCLPLVPFISMLDPGFLTLAGAPALIVVGIVMLSVLSRMNLEDPLQVIPLAITVGFMIFTYNITLGIAASLVAYPFVAIAVGKAREVHPVAWALAALSVALFAMYPY
jgi:AGZA family xanthine/uracil permease-like MFS transporter